MQLVGVCYCRACGRSFNVSSSPSEMAYSDFKFSSALHRLPCDVQVRKDALFMKIVVIQPSKFWARILKGFFKI